MIELGEADIKRACLELGYDEEFTELMTDKKDQVQIRDSNGTVLNTVEHPVAVVDNIDDELLVLLKIGEDSIMSE